MTILAASKQPINTKKGVWEGSYLDKKMDSKKGAPKEGSKKDKAIDKKEAKKHGMKVK